MSQAMPETKEEHPCPVSTPGWETGAWQGNVGLAKAQKLATSIAEARTVPLTERTRESTIDLSMMARLMVGKYRNTWRGHVLLKDAVSLHHYQVLMEKLRPKTIIELGTAGGGGAVWFATQAQALGLDDCAVVTLDIQDSITDACKSDFGKLGVKFMQMDLYDSAGVQRAIADLPHPWLVSEDCHVDANVVMQALDDEMIKGDYIVYEDTHLCTPDKSWMDAEDMDNYEYGKFAGQKLDRVEEAMSERAAAWAIDASIQDLYGYNGSTFVNSLFTKTC